MTPCPTDAPSTDAEKSAVSGKRTRGYFELIIVLVGIVIGQAILYGPSLVGRKILLPLDILAVSGAYLPRTPEVEKIVPQDDRLSDVLYSFEPARRFAVSEIHAGRFPVWAPYQYAGAPFVWPKYSPFLLLGCSTASPIIIAWAQLLSAIVAGLGAYLFFRRALGVCFWAATIPAWCYPMTGFFIFWQGFPTCGAVYWLPWLFLAVDRAARRASLGSLIALSAVTCLVPISGHVDVAGQVLLAAGGFAVWCLLDAHPKKWFCRQSGKAIAILAFGWSLGFLLAAPYLLPLLEYGQEGARVTRRSAGAEERPPVGLSALTQVVLPDAWGSSRRGSVPIKNGNQLESSAATYVGVLAILLVAPLAWCSRSHRSSNVFWSILGFVGLSWSLDVPILVDLLRLPVLRMMSHNRFVFATSFAILALVATGLDALWRGKVQWQRGFLLPAILLAGIGLWCAANARILPPRIGANLETIVVVQKQTVFGVSDLEGIRRVQSWFRCTYAVSAALCGLGVAGWLFLWRKKNWQPGFLFVLGLFMLGDLFWFAYGRNPQCDPKLYYPRIPVLDQLAKAAPGRVMGIRCLPASLAQTHGLWDIRGYDGVDPESFTQLMHTTGDRDAQVYILPHALTQWLVPRSELSPPDGIRLPGVLNLLGVKYVIFRGSPPASMRPVFESFDYWALINHAALPRVFVPTRVDAVPDKDERLEKLTSPQFDPREVAYVESPVDLPVDCRGEAKIDSEIPTRVTVSIQMATPGLVVLADLWDKGWRAYLNGRPVPILRANHAVRGVVVPAGAATVEFRYESASFRLGLQLAGLAVVILLGALGVILRSRRGGKPSRPSARS